MRPTLLLADVEVDGRRTDVEIDDGVVSAVAPGLPRSGREQVVHGRGGALIPGLHDHHVHLLAAAAAHSSIDCGPAAVVDLAGLGRALRGAATRGDRTLRGVGYHESVAGPLDRHLLDGLVRDRPVRIQHRSGALWMLNSLALAHVARLLDHSPDVERDERGAPTGRLWRYDARLGPAWADRPPDLAALGRRLTRLGITGVTDATPDLTPASAELIARAVGADELPVRVMLLGTNRTEDLLLGPRKLLLRDHDLPGYDELRDAVAEAHGAGRPVAVHCVTRQSLLLTLAVLDEVGALPGDRLEHAAVVPEGIAPRIARLGLSVVTQPDFLRTRGDTYLDEVDPRDRQLLYPYASLAAAGVRVTASSDAPFGELDPWRVIRSATRRTTAGGRLIGPAESVTAAAALAGYLSDPESPGGRPRTVRPGAPAELCLLHTPLARALAEPSADLVRAVVSRGGYRPAAAE
ncbi:amidohydrolase family protein [Nocardioides sp.]|uniref:amidohydrolase family protein n=1 Tax=Nocardioides sp. TaxID=35761 RepID=UPI0039E32660